MTQSTQREERAREATINPSAPNQWTKIARASGVLFIVATAASLLSTAFLGPMNSSDHLTSMAANANQVTFGAFLAVVAALASATIAISLYPVLRRYSEALALGAVGLRLIEGVFYVVGVVYLLMMLGLSQQFVSTGPSDPSYFQNEWAVLLSGYHSAGNEASLLAFCLGAGVYYYIFYQSRLVPRWLAGWGIIGAAMLFVGGLLGMFSVVGALSPPQLVLALPIAVQEMALAVWLIVRGFSPSAAAQLRNTT